MKPSRFPNDRPLANDHEKMIETINALKAAGHRFHRPTQYQLKVGAWNFYPTTGRVIREDSALAENERGLEAFLNLLALDQPKWRIARLNEIGTS